MNDVLINYISDFIYLVKEEENNLKSKTNLNDFDEATKFAYYNILEKLKTQADSFQIDLKEMDFMILKSIIKERTGHNNGYNDHISLRTL